MRVAVTGGSGKIGSETVRQLRAKGHDVLSLDIRPPTDLTIPHRVVDLRAASAVRAAFDGMDAVCHIGEIPSLHHQSPSALIAHNVEVGSSVIQTAADVGIKQLIYTSTCQIYGCWGVDVGPLVAPEKLPLDESAARRPQNAYALSKVCNEMYAELVVQRFPMAIAAFRFPWVMGHWETERVVKYAIDKHRTMPADGLGTYVGRDDAANAYVCALERGWTGFEAFHFVADDILADEPVAEGIARHYPALNLPSGWPEHQSPVSTEKARRLLGWAPKFQFSDYVRDARAKLPKSA